MTGKHYRLLGADDVVYSSDRPGVLGGNRKLKIYGRLDCGTARAALPKGYGRHRVFFADRAAAIAAGYRPCGNCLREEYAAWKAGPQAGVDYPWRAAPHGG
jgi:hypothetical protein